MEEKKSLTFSKDDMLKMLPVIMSDLRHHHSPEMCVANNENIRRDLYYHVIREMYSEDLFLFNEKLNDGSCREGQFIKGYVRDVWSYLQDAYDLIHKTDFENTNN